MIYDYEHNQPPIVAENRRQWQAIKRKVAALLQFTQEMKDEICLENGKEDAALLAEESEYAAAKQQRTPANETA